MALSLQDQLLKAGLADKQKAKKVKKEKHKKLKAQQKHKVTEVDEAKVAAEQALQAKKEKDQALNKQAKAIAEEKAVLAQVKQLISLNKQAKNNGELVCNFTDNNKIKRLFVDKATQKHISQGKLAIVKDDDAYEIVPIQVADKIKQRIPEAILYVAEKEQSEAASSEEDDWYAEYEIPDDLTW